MAVVNFATREITARIVYFGAGGAGCNTNVRKLYDLLGARERSRLHKFGTVDSREISWYFDYVPIEASVAGDFQLRMRVYSLPGGIALPAHREVVLDQVDGVVFVADSRRDQAAANLDSLLELEKVLAMQGMELAALPVVMQVNHGDNAEARPIKEVAFDLNPYGFPLVSAVASRGDGVVEAHAELSQRIGKRIQSIMSGKEAKGRLIAEYRPDVDRDEAVVHEHLAEIRSRSPAGPEALLEATEETEVLSPVDSVLEIPFPMRELHLGRPLEVLGAEIEGDRILIHLLLDPHTGAEVTRKTISLNLAPGRSATATPAPVAAAPAHPAFVDRSGEPDEVSAVVATPPSETADVVGWIYGFAGMVGGIAMGIMLGYLVGL